MDARQRSQRSDYVGRESTRVLVGTPSGVFEGDFHHAAGVRLSDAIRNSFAADRHLLLTDVILHGDDGLAESVSRAQFILINGDHANVIIPIDEADAVDARAAMEVLPVELRTRTAA